jgi:hypothetical protein
MLDISKVDVWAATIDDKPGGINGKLEALAKAGADLEFIVARRAKEQPGQGVLFVTPLRGDAQINVARAAGFGASEHLHSVRIEAPDEPGLGFLLTRALAAAGINLRGLSAATINHRGVFLLAFDTAADADLAIHRLERGL